MAYKEVLRVEIQEVIRRWQAGNSQRQIAEGTGLSRATVRKYLSAAKGEGIAQDGPAPSKEQLSRLAGISQAGPKRVETPVEDSLARREQLDYASFLEIIHSDEVNRRAQRRIELRLNGAGFEETCRLEDFDWSAWITLDRRLLDAVFSLEFLDKHEHVLLVGPAGVGKSFLAQVSRAEENCTTWVS